jgi:2-polyprenyl-3-methyl-5-hydroxy-6-metoxy-1,4-benzoquinol methylase
MDAQTIAAYERSAEKIAERQRSIQPMRLYHRIQAFFHPGGLTGDIGCGSGRDLAWLADQGLPCIGYDAAAGMRQVAQNYFPDLEPV